MNVYYFTHRGNIRYKNEDAILINDILITEKNFSSVMRVEINDYDEKPQLYLVADGMGGHQKGEVASFLVLDYFRKKRNNITSQNELLKTLQETKKILNEYAVQHSHAFGLGTVISGLWIYIGQYMIFNVGDSRVYRFKDNNLVRLSKDHSVVEELKDAGYLSEDDIRTHPEKHIITSCIMGDNEESIKSIFMKSYNKNFFNGSKALVCSDGLWEMLYENEIYQCMNLETSLKICECLKNKAFINGATDNISFILLEF